MVAGYAHPLAPNRHVGYSIEWSLPRRRRIPSYRSHIDPEGQPLSQEIVGPPVGNGHLLHPVGRSITMGATAIPIHRPERLSFVHKPDRDEAWRLLGTSVRERLHRRAGVVAEWWAYASDEGRVHAIVLGDRAMVSATPTVNACGGPAHVVESVRLHGGSARTVAVAEDTTGCLDPDGALSDARRSAPMDASLPAAMRGFLGNLPACAQQALREPFQFATDQLYHGYHYSRTALTNGFGESGYRSSVTCTTGAG
jgi:hypothetical protein